VIRVGSLFRELRRRGVLQTTAVYIVGAWVILQAANVLFPGAGIPDSAIRFVFIGAVVGFPLVMTFGWMYDITVTGIRRTPASELASGDNLPLRKPDYILLATLATLATGLVVGVFAQVMNQAQPTDVVAAELTAAENSIAVLPFVNMSDSADNEYFGDGIAEELLNELANLASLQVAARTSSFFFKGKNEPIQSIGRQLGVRNVLEGSVRKSGNRLRITAQLINVANGYHLWSETYDRKMGDIFAIQEDIARAITTALEVKILGHESRRLSKSPTDNFGAYDFFLLGQHHREQRNPESLEKSLELFDQALELDDQFALGYAEKALSYLYQAYYSGRSPEDVVALTEPLLRKSLELDPDLPKAHATRASVRLLVRDFEAADAGYRKALELRPNYSGAWGNLGFSMVLQSRLEEAAAAYEKSEVLDPLNATQHYNFGALKMLTGRYDEGLAEFKKVVELSPERTATAAAITHWSIVYGRFEEAAQWALKSLAKEPDSVRTPRSLAQIYGNLGIWDKAWEALSRANEMSPDNVGVFREVANFYFQTSDHAGFSSFVASEYEKIDRSASSQYSPTDQARYFWHGVSALLEGNYIQAVDDLTESAGGEDGIVNAVYDEITALKYIAYAYQKQGQDDAAAALLTQCLDLAKNALAQGWNTPAIHYRTAQVYALLGDSDNAIAELQQAVDKGWRAAGGLERDPLWSPLQEDVRFQAIVTQVNDDLEVQRNRVAVILAEL